MRWQKVWLSFRSPRFIPAIGKPIRCGSTSRLASPTSSARAARGWPSSSRGGNYRFRLAVAFLRAGFFAGLRADFAPAFFFVGFPARAEVVRALFAGLRLVPALRRALGAAA